MARFHCLTFLTDYGLADAFVAVCHGIAAQIAPDLRIIDITHLIPLGDIRRGAVVLAQAVPYLPPAVHVAVVDPGVGTARRAVAVEAGGSLFVGPDNGLLSAAVSLFAGGTGAGGAVRAVSLTNTALWRDTTAATFHGRDIFMPVAARLAAGLPLDEAGDPVDAASLIALPRPQCRVTGDAAHVEVVTVDGFGNVQLSLPGSDASRAGLLPGTVVTLAWDGRETRVPFVTAFGDVAPGELLCYRDSGDWVAIAVAGGDAARRLGLRPGTRITLTNVMKKLVTAHSAASMRMTALGTISGIYPHRTHHLLGPIWSTRVTNVARLLLGLVAVLAAPVLVVAAAAATALPATATALPVAAKAVTHGSQWWLTSLHVPAALRMAPAAGKGVTVAVLSTGVDPSQPDLAGDVTTGPDFAKTGRNPGQPYWGAEGTAVASLIAGHGHGPGGTEGITGVAPDARILSLQVTLEYDDPLNSDSAITRRLPAAIAAGIRYAVGHGATVIALPLDPGTLGPASSGDPAAAGGSAAEDAAVSFALAHDVLLVAPAGDNGAGANSVSYPAAYPGVIAVGATEHDGQLAPFTSTRSYVALTAPGAGIAPGTLPSGGTPADPAGLTVAAPDGGYQSLASTDMSAALTAGVAALIRSRYPGLTVAEVTQSLERGVTAPPGRASRSVAAGWGHGELDAAAALTSAAAIAAAHPAPAPAPAPAPSKAVAVRPATTGTAHRAVPVRPDPGRLLRSLIVDTVAAACALIACLIGALTLTRLRRRARSAKAAGSAAGARQGYNPSHASHARHAKGQPDALVTPVPAPAVIWPGTPARGPFTADAGHAPHRLRRPAPKPPWPPALPPGNPAPLALPAAKPVPEAADDGLPPWEQSPADFAAAPSADDAAAWPGSNTGPMYVWNPVTTTAPLRIIEHDEDEAD